jgi:hypothetical protein
MGTSRSDPAVAASRCYPIHPWHARRRIDMRAIGREGWPADRLVGAFVAGGRPCTAPPTTGSSRSSLPSARPKGASGYPGDGANRWAAVHRSEAARLVALGLQKGAGGSPPARRRRTRRSRPRVRPSDRPRVRPARHLSRLTTPPATSAGSAPTSPRTEQRRAPRPMSSSAGRPPGPTLIEDLDSGAYSPR